MKKVRLAKTFLEELAKTPIVNAVCNKLNISRQTIYRWINEDPEFEDEYEKCLKYGINNINELAESKVISSIQNGDLSSCKFWLENNKKNYSKPKYKGFWDPFTDDSLRKIIIETLLPRAVTDKDLIANKESRKQSDDTLPLL